MQVARSALAGRRAGDEARHRRLLPGLERDAGRGPLAIGPAADDDGVQGDGRQTLQGVHLVVVELGGEHHPAGQGRRQDRGGDGLERMAVDHHHPCRRVVGLHGGADDRGGVADGSVVGGRDRAVDSDDERHVDAQALAQVLERGLDGGLVVGGDCGAEAEVARQQGRVVVELLGAQGPEAVEHRAAGRQFLARHPCGVAGDGAIDGERDQGQGDAEQGGVEHRQPGPQVSEHRQAHGQYRLLRSGGARRSAVKTMRPAPRPVTVLPGARR